MCMYVYASLESKSFLIFTMTLTGHTVIIQTTVKIKSKRWVSNNVTLLTVTYYTDHFDYNKLCTYGLMCICC